MKASASISIGDWYKSVDVELDSTIDGSEIAKTIKEALDSAFADDAN